MVRLRSLPRTCLRSFPSHSWFPWISDDAALATQPLGALTDLLARD